MGMGKYLILLTFLMSFSFWILLGLNTPVTDMIVCFQNPERDRLVSENSIFIDPSGATTNRQNTCGVKAFGEDLNYFTIIGLILVALTVSGIAAMMLPGSNTVFPDPYRLFGTISIFLFYFATFPIGVLNSAGGALPGELRLLIGGMFLIMFVISFLEFIKGGSL